MTTTRNIQSLERALSILELFIKGENEQSVGEISVALGLSKSTTFGLINTLHNRGYLYQNEKTKEYGLGLKVLSLTEAVEKNNIIIKIVRPYLKSLVQQFQETAHCAMLNNNVVTYIDKAEASRSVSINSRIGDTNPLYCTGVGKCILAYMDERKINNILNDPLPTFTENTITNRDELHKELLKIRQNGYAVDNEEIEKGLTCCAVPVLNSDGKVNLAISVSGPTVRIKSANITNIVNSLKEVADKMSLEIEKQR